MAAWLESERAQVRHALGYSAIFLQAEPRLEYALTAVLAVTDGGTRPDNSTQVQIQGWLADVATLETNLKALWPLAAGGQIDEITADIPRATALLRMEGRRIVTYISKALATAPRADIFSSTPVNTEANPFSGSGYGVNNR